MSVSEVGLIELEPTQVQALLASGEAVLVDVREDEEFAEEHIEGSVLYPMSDFELETWPSYPGRKIIISCLGGVRSAAVARKLIASGQGWAVHLKGGLNAWRDAGLPTVTAA
ncbi:putative Rhodanese domain protein [Magnetospirillum sp. XM-1]|uniref:rhodanese-like domain-containing protein n=1 Tax=Magnetospirillum sp. XM-1 TaxID=1663591 RepID=UPI00073DBA92|nr:rhodanese-like domain-containing protein [Magnetospirillum sp. XM-1]CUW40910.1 putative Rhodanese domain protein [Magnetospirillum sp. XM-1]